MCKISSDKYGLFLFTNGHCFRPQNPAEAKKSTSLESIFNEDDSVKEITFHKDNITLHKVIETENSHRLELSEIWYSHGEYLNKKGKQIKSKKLFKSKSDKGNFITDFFIKSGEFLTELFS